MTTARASSSFRGRCLEFLIIVFLLFSSFLCVCSGDNIYPESRLTSTCFDTAPGTSDRTDTTIRLIYRGWTSHDLVLYATEILLKEVLNYDVIIVDGSTSNTWDWGVEITNGVFDMDPESWQSSNEASREYITKSKTVVDFGAVGYAGRAGVFIAGADILLAEDQYSDFYLYYQDASGGISGGLPKWGEIDLEGMLGDDFPACGSSWCSSGDFKGYYIPPQCEGVLDDETECLEIAMVRPTWDAGYFEQLTTNLNLKAYHAYYDSHVSELIQDRLAAGKPTLFYRWTPDSLVTLTQAGRLSYPDFYVGCDADNTFQGDGPVSCDYPETTLEKFGSASLSKPAYYMFKRMSFATADMEGMLSNHTSTNGPYDAAGAACAWVKSNMNRVFSTFAPMCISQPKGNPQTGDLVFDEDAMECIATTVYPKSTLTSTCLADEDLGSADRSDVTIRVGIRDWTSQTLTAMLSAIMLKDLLGYTVQLVNLTDSSASDWGSELSDSLFDFDGENWLASPEVDDYATYIQEAETVLDLGEIGYGGRRAMWTFKKTLEATPLASYYKFWKDASRGFAAGFPAWQDIDAATIVGDDFPVCSPDVASWCPTGTLAGYWAPDICEASPTSCVEFLMSTPEVDTGYFEQLTSNLGLQVIHGYYTTSKLSALVQERYANNLATVFWWWQPSPLISLVDAERISYPDFSYGCNAADNQNADTGALQCDYPETRMRKLGSSRLLDVAPHGYYFLTLFKITLAQMNDMLSYHVDGGGSLNTQDAACKHLKGEWTAYKAYAADCISNPRVYPDISIGHTVFDTDEHVCVVVDCPAYQVLAADGTRVFCQNCSAGLIPNDDQSACTFCSSGTAVSSDGTTCDQCPPGYYSEYRGSTECEPCAKGTYMATTGATACNKCEKGEYQDDHGETSCKTCENGKTTDSRGTILESRCKCPSEYYLAADNSSCEPCPEGMECSFGSEYANFAKYSSDSTVSIPMVLPGYFTLSADPLSVYLCDDEDEDTCPGGRSESCGLGRIGLLCEVCPEGQGIADNACSDCGAGPGVLIWAGLPVGLIVLALIMFRIANDKVTVNVGVPLMASVFFGLVITTCQSLALFPQLSVQWRSQNDFFNGFRFLLGSPDGVSLSCAIGASPVIRFAFRCLLPVFCVVAICLVWTVGRIVGRLQNRATWSGNIAHNTLGQLLQALFIAIGVLVVQPLRCYSHPNGQSSMSLFPVVLCWEASDHYVIVVLGILVGCFFVFPFLSGCVWAMVVAPSRLDPVGHYERWRFLLYRFRADVWWWGVVFLVRQLALAFSACVPADSPHWQINYVAIVTCIYLVAVATRWPWKNRILNILDIASMMLVNLVIVSSGPFATDNSDDINSFVVFHFILIGAFGFMVFCIGAHIVHTAVRNGFHSEYFFFIGPTYTDSIANDWISFVSISSKLPPETVRRCIESFNEFDVGFLSMCMSSFQSLDPGFGAKTSKRLDTISHSSCSIEELKSKVRVSIQGSLETEKGSDRNSVFSSDIPDPPAAPPIRAYFGTFVDL